MSKAKKRIIWAIVLTALLAMATTLGLAATGGEDTTVNLKYHNLSYKSNISIKYAVEVTGLPDGIAIADAVGVTVRKGDTDYEARYEGQTVISGKEYSVFGFFELSADEMTVDVYATPYVKLSDTKTVTGNTHKNSVLNYAYKILGKIEGGNNAPDRVKRLVTAMLEYGSAVQDYTGNSTDRLADADYYQISAVNSSLPDGFDEGLYLKGESVTLTATPKTGYTFVGWEKNGVSVGTSKAINITVGEENATYCAVFEKIDTRIVYELDGGTLPEGGIDAVIPALLMNVLGNGTLGVILLAIIMVLLLSASMSTLEAVVLTSSSAVAVDLIPAVSKKEISAKSQMRLTRILCLVFVACSFIFATRNIPIIVSLMSFSWGIISGCFIGPYIWGLFSKKITRIGAYAGIVSGLATVGIATLVISLKSGFSAAVAKSPELGVCAMAISLIIVPVVSLITQKRVTDKERVEEIFSCFSAE